jgi:hypothetical protein
MFTGDKNLVHIWPGITVFRCSEKGFWSPFESSSNASQSALKVIGGSSTNIEPLRPRKRVASSYRLSKRALNFNKRPQTASNHQDKRQ